MSHSPVLWHVTMSLDGHIAAPGDEMAWVFEYVDASRSDGVGARTGAVVAGRRSFEVGSRDGREVLDGAWSGPQLTDVSRHGDVVTLHYRTEGQS